MAQQVLWLEPVGGIAGDMFLAAALDLGVALADIEGPVRSLGLTGWRFTVSRQERHAITGTHVDVTVETPPQGHEHRRYRDIEAMIQASALPPRAKTRALEVFRRIGEVEAHIHGTTLDDIHFHEVGAVDSIVDICAAAMVLEALGDPQVFSAPPPLGSGTVKIAHGVVPVPVPATLALLKDLPVRFEGVGELTTPTGAALLKTFASIAPPPAMRVTGIGYGVGTKDFKDRANLLRMSLGTPTQQSDALVTLECNLDDCSPQILGAVIEQLLAAGALDAWVSPVVMKKNRPGHLLGVLTRVELKDALLTLIFRETTTLGVREMPLTRHALERRFDTVQTPWGPVRMKVGLQQGRDVNAVPEFDECRALATTHGVALKEVQLAAWSAWQQRRK